MHEKKNKSKCLHLFIKIRTEFSNVYSEQQNKVAWISTFLSLILFKSNLDQIFKVLFSLENCQFGNGKDVHTFTLHPLTGFVV